MVNTVPAKYQPVSIVTDVHIMAQSTSASKYNQHRATMAVDPDAVPEITTIYNIVW